MAIGGFARFPTETAVACQPLSRLECLPSGAHGPMIRPHFPLAHILRPRRQPPSQPSKQLASAGKKDPVISSSTAIQTQDAIRTATWPGRTTRGHFTRMPLTSRKEETMDRPRVITLSIASVDGRMAVSRASPLLYGDPRWNALPDAQDVVLQVFREVAPMANLEGSGSFVPDDVPPGQVPTAGRCVPTQDFLPPANVAQAEGRGWFAVVDGRGRVGWSIKVGPSEPYLGWPLLVLVCEATPPDYLAFLRAEGIAYLVAGKERVDLAAALAKMREVLGVERVLSTAGGRLSGALLRAGLVDEVNVVVLPALIGTHDAPTLFEATRLGKDERPLCLRLLSATTYADEIVWLRYEAKSAIESPSPATTHSES